MKTILIDKTAEDGDWLRSISTEKKEDKEVMDRRKMIDSFLSKRKANMDQANKKRG